MSISAPERAVLLGTDNTVIQIRKIVESRPDMVISETELKEIFQDVSEGMFWSAIYTLTGRGIMELRDGLVHVLRKMSESATEQVMRAIQIKRTFTVKDISYLLPLRNISTIRSILHRLLDKGVISEMGTDPSRMKIYRYEGEKTVAKNPRTSTRKYGEASSLVCSAIEKLDTFSTRDIQEELPNVSYKTIANILWSLKVKDGIEEVGIIDGTSYKIYRKTETWTSEEPFLIPEDIHIENKLERIWSIIRSFDGNGFSPADIREKLPDLDIKYIRRRLCAWHRAGHLGRKHIENTKKYIYWQINMDINHPRLGGTTDE